MEDDVFSGPRDKVDDVSSFSSRSSDVNVNSSLVSESQASSCLINNLISFVGVAAPSGVYNAAKARRRKKQRCDKGIDPVLRSILQNVSTIFAPPSKARSPASALIFYTVDGQPKPKLFPKLSCSLDPAFYDEAKKWTKTGQWRWDPDQDPRPRS